MNGKPLIQHSPDSATIKGILRRYPEGQIFKELIQNADDAGAKVVKFIVDECQYGTSHLADGGMAQYQGPALLAYNDAQFKPVDWEGIQLLQSSKKAQNPIKVGKFGIGFNAVYHITDLPIIISGDRMGFLDPQEKVHSKGGWYYELSEIWKNKDICLDTMAPFVDKEGFSWDLQMYYPGTLFRFPLRKDVSDISENVFTVGSICALLKTFKQEAKYLLLFLQSVTRIEIIDKINHVQIIIADERQIHAKDAFIQNVHATWMKYVSGTLHGTFPPMSLVMKLHVDVTIQDCLESKHHWLVAYYLGCPGDDDLCKAKKLNVMPYVGAAMELDAIVSSGGRVFCFLPMPEELTCPLPVHINGTFGTSDDRRSLKWRSAESPNDIVAMWNEIIVSRLLPSCYASLITEACQHLIPCDIVYKMWPDNTTLVESKQWKAILDPLLKLLCKRHVFQTAGKWISLDEAVLIPGVHVHRPPGWAVVCKVVARCNKKLVELPQNVWNCLKVSGDVMNELTPLFATKLLKQHSSSYVSLSSAEKLKLLRYCLSEKRYSSVVGLELLPLANDTLVTFCTTAEEGKLIYLCANRYPLELFPKMCQHMLVNINDPEIQLVFQGLALSKKTQLRILDDKITGKILSDFVSPKHESFRQWLPYFWKWSESHKLEHFVGQKLIPLSHPAKGVAQITLNSGIIYVDEDVDEKLLQCLQQLSISYVKLSEYSFFQHDDIKNYTQKFSPNGLLNALQYVQQDRIIVDSENAYILQQFLSGAKFPTSVQNVAVLMSLPIFSRTTDTAVSAKKASLSSWEGKVVVIPDTFDASCLPSSLVVLNHNNRALLEKFAKEHVIFPNSMDMIKNVLLPMVAKGAVESGQLDAMMKYILHFLCSKNIDMYDVISKLSFIRVDDTEIRKCPNKLYSPEVFELRELFHNEPVFPLPPFDDKVCTKYLNYCGLVKSISPQMVIKVVSEISEIHSPIEVDGIRLSRACGALNYLFTCSDKELNSFVFYEQKQVTFKLAVRHLLDMFCWLPILCTRPNYYPDALKWAGSDYPSHFTSKSKNVFIVSASSAFNLPFIAGSQVLIVQTRTRFIAPKRLCELGFSEMCSVAQVLNHLELIVNTCNNISKDVLRNIVYHIYDFLSTSSEITPIKACKFPWIMIDEGHFAHPYNVATKGRQGCRLIDLKEYHQYVLPDALEKYFELFTRCGVQKETTDEQLLSVLCTMKEKGDYTPQTLKIVIIILNCLTNDSMSKVYLSLGSILYVPVRAKCEHFELVDAAKVVYSKDDWGDYEDGSDGEGPSDGLESCSLLHREVSCMLAECLNIRSLEHHSPFGATPFGQSEDITNRIKTILRDYPFDITFMKELIQNADDAKASKVYFILDRRTHEKTRPLTPTWGELQGPALLVWNDSEFSEEDLKGIQDMGRGSKSARVESVGQYGIGFNVVYHITDCPSFITRNNLYVLDPYCKYIQSKDLKRPGCSFEVNQKFLTYHYPLKTAYLYCNVKMPENVNSGTLFRFPFKMSFVDSTDPSNIMFSKFREWVHQDIKLALLFLNNVTEFKMCIIDHDSSFHVFYHCKRELKKSVTEDFSKLSNAVKTFSMHSVPHHIWYQVTLLEIVGTKETSDSWMIQQGVGDRDGNVKSWQFINTTKPQHGIAVPFNPSIAPRTNGQVFCFLPLPIRSRLPVHINGRFCLDSSRRALWTSSVPDKCDDKQRWNEDIGKAISSSYAVLLSNMAPEYVTVSPYEQDIDKKLEHFFSLFPNWKKYLPEGFWLQVAKGVYKSLANQNAFILCKKYITNTGVQVQWHPIIAVDKVNQIYFPCDSDDLLKLLERMGLNFTCTTFSEAMFLRFGGRIGYY